MTEFTEKNQWSLIEKYFQKGESGKISQFMRDNGCDFGDNIKFYTAVLDKYNKVKEYSEEDRQFIISEGKNTGKNLLQKKFNHLIPSKLAQPKPEQPKPEQPKPEQPKPEQPKPEQPKPEQPKPEQPKPEQPKPEQPKPEIVNNIETASKLPIQIKPKSFLEILASMNKEQRLCFFQILEDVSEPNLPKLLRLLEYSERIKSL
jgi:hypothetical protein